MRIAATIRPARQAPTAPHTAPHTGTRLLHASVAHFDVLYFNLRVAGVPLFKADRGAPPVMGVSPIYRSTNDKVVRYKRILTGVAYVGPEASG